MIDTRIARASALFASFVFFAACSSQSKSDPASTSSAAPLVNGQAVTWTGLVNTTVQGDSLVKTGGQAQMEDAGGVSAQQIASGPASMQFTMSETTTFKFVGFGHSTTWPKAAGIDFAFRMQSGTVDVYENNTWVADNTGAVGDLFEIDVNGSTIKYSKNGTVFHTTTKTPTYPLIVAASIIDSGGTIKAAQVAGGSSGTCGGSSDAGSTSDAGSSITGHHLAGWLAGSPQWSENNSAAGDPYFEWFAKPANAAKFDSIHPTWWAQQSSDGCCTGGTVFCTTYGNPASTKSGCVNGDVVPAAHAAGTKIVPMFAAAGSAVTTMLSSASSRQAWAQEIASDATTYGYDGVDIDFEHFDNAQRDDFTSFMSTLRSLLPAGAILAVAVDGATASTNEAGWNLSALATIADQVEIMGYDFHFMGGSHAGPVDPLDWVKAVTSYVSSLNGGSTKRNFLWGLPNYGIEGPDSPAHAGGVVSAPQEGLALWRAKLPGGYSSDASSEFATCPLNDQGWSAGLSPNGILPDGNRAYFDDIDSLAQRVAAAAASGLGGVTYWTVGDEADGPTNQFSDYFTMVRHYFPKQ